MATALIADRTGLPSHERGAQRRGHVGPGLTIPVEASLFLQHRGESHMVVASPFEWNPRRRLGKLPASVGFRGVGDIECLVCSVQLMLRTTAAAVEVIKPGGNAEAGELIALAGEAPQ